MDGEVTKLGKYQIIGMLGRGAMGTVYRAFDPMIERTVAIKTMRRPEAGDEAAREAEERFVREAKAAGRLTHPNIVGVYDFGEDGDTAFIVMELVEGRTLKALIEQDGCPPPAEVVAIMTGVLGALEYSHRNEVVHRDIKPANIIITAGHEVKIMDFGVAKIESSSMTQAGTLLGTPSYMSPEQFLGEVVDARSDLFSAGAVLYELLTGQKPFSGSFATVMQRVLNETPPLPTRVIASVPPAFNKVVTRALAKKAADRYQSAAEFAEDLRSALAAPVLAEDVAEEDGTVIMARPPIAPPPLPSSEENLPPSPQRTGVPKMAAWVGGVATAAAIIGGLTWLLLPPPSLAPVVPASVEAPKPVETPKPAVQDLPHADSAPSSFIATVSVTTEHGSTPTYRVGDEMRMTATVSADAFVYCFYQQANGDVFRVFPNADNTNPRLAAGQQVQVPGASSFKIRFDVADAQEAVGCLASPIGIGTIEPILTSTAALSPLPYASVRMLAHMVRQRSEDRVSADIIDIKVTK